MKKTVQDSNVPFKTLKSFKGKTKKEIIAHYFAQGIEARYCAKEKGFYLHTR